MILKRLGAPLTLWEELSKKSKKFQHGDCSSRWSSFKAYNFTVGSLLAMAKEGDTDKLNAIRPTLHVSNDIFDDRTDYPCTTITLPF